jgi:hypothetical protein
MQDDRQDVLLGVAGLEKRGGILGAAASKMHPGLKRNFRLMPGAEWLELLCRALMGLLPAGCAGSAFAGG